MKNSCVCTLAMHVLSSKVHVHCLRIRVQQVGGCVCRRKIEQIIEKHSFYMGNSLWGWMMTAWFGLGREIGYNSGRCVALHCKMFNAANNRCFAKR
jgi:hypothetical protein